MTDSNALLKTPFHDMHVAAGAKMVPFAGYDMPVQYPSGVLQEHLHCREAAGLFDVSHMGQIEVRGDNMAAALEQLLPVDVKGLAEQSQRYALLLNDDGGILDDLMVANRGDNFLLVVNAACKHDDLAWLKSRCPELSFELQDDKALLALQGPKAREILSTLNPAVAELSFMQTGAFDIANIPVWLSCSGYTGEDGFEISVDAANAEAIAECLLSRDGVQWLGLGARDSLRLEAGLCLYGHDLSKESNPVSANLKWAVSPVRREGAERAGGYIGAEAVQQAWRDGTPQKRVLLDVDGRAPVRESTTIVNAGGEAVGVVSSGGFAPSLKQPIAMGYVASDCIDRGEAIYASLRGRQIALTPRNKAFVEQRYFRG